MTLSGSMVDALEELLDDLVTDGTRRVRRVFGDGSQALVDEFRALTVRIDDLVTTEMLQAPRRRGRTKRLLKLRDLERKVAAVQASIEEMVEDPEGRARTGRRGRRPKPIPCLVEDCDEPRLRDGLCARHLSELEKAKREMSPNVIRRRKKED